MCSVAPHDPSGPAWFPPKNTGSVRVRASRSSVKFQRVSTTARGAPRFLCQQSVIPPTPLISAPPRPRLSASQSLLCAPRRRCEAGEKRIGKPQFHQHFTVALRKRCARVWRRVSGRAWRARVRVFCWERRADGLRGSEAPPLRTGRTHMEAEREAGLPGNRLL